MTQRYRYNPTDMTVFDKSPEGEWVQYDDYKKAVQLAYENGKKEGARQMPHTVGYDWPRDGRNPPADWRDS